MFCLHPYCPYNSENLKTLPGERRPFEKGLRQNHGRIFRTTMTREIALEVIPFALQSQGNELHLATDVYSKPRKQPLAPAKVTWELWVSCYQKPISFVKLILRNSRIAPKVLVTRKRGGRLRKLYVAPELTGTVVGMVKCMSQTAAKGTTASSLESAWLRRTVRFGSLFCFKRCSFV